MPTTFSFTKLVVHDLEAMTTFYERVYGLKRFDRVKAEVGSDPIDEIMLGVDSAHGPGSIVLLQWLGQDAPMPGAVILGFITDDLEALVERTKAEKGTIHAPIRESPEHGVRVAFTKDPEGNLAEIVQLQS